MYNFLMFLEEAPESNPMSTWIVLAVVIVLMVLLFIIPQSKNKKKAKAMMESMKVGSKITTIGGIIGTIIELSDKDGSIVIETGDDENVSRMRFTKNAIYYVFPSDTPAQESDVIGETGVVYEEVEGLNSIDEGEDTEEIK